MLKHKADEFGLSFDNLSYDWSKVIGRSRNIADKLAGGIEFLFKKSGIDYIRGMGSIPESGKVEVTAADGSTETHEADHILVSTGAATREMPGLPFNGTTVIGSKEALVMENQPDEIIIIGAGAIGVEFAYFFNAFGTKVTIVEMMDRGLPVEDDDASKAVGISFKKQGIKVKTGTKVIATEESGDKVTITLEKGDKTETITAPVCLVAIGVKPVLPGGVPLKLDAKGWIETDSHYRTSVKGVYAAGDIIGPPWLAHVASFEAIQAVEGMFTDNKPKKVRNFPGCTYCQPQVASVGLTERAAKEKGIAHKVGKFPFNASGKALAVGEPEGFVKIIFGEPHGEVIGAHIVGSEATEMIAEMGLAMELEATKDEIEATIHAHPTLTEAIHEATGAAFGHAIHIPN